MRVRALPEGCHKSTRQCKIARRARKDASVAGGKPQEHKVTSNCQKLAEFDGRIDVNMLSLMHHLANRESILP